MTFREGSTEAPRLCERGCGFFGSPETNNLCSKCYSAYLKENAVEAFSLMKISGKPSPTTVSNETVIDDIDSNSAGIVKKNRCQCCNKRVGMLGFGCRCGGMFCGLHRHPEEHACTFDHKSRYLEKLEKENPRLRAQKLDERV